MKKQLLTASLLLCASFASTAQTVFWTEGFSTGCNQGTLANGFSGTNGSWTTTTTGTNDPYANVFFVSATEAFTGSGNCGSGCLTNASLTDGTLHVGAVAIPSLTVADEGATYNTGGICGFGICVATNVRAESPVINCSGKTNITLSFDYIENGDGTNDDATVWYFDGSTWALLGNPAKTPMSTCTPQGEWTPFSIPLPASADNNANVKIGFNWTNNDDAIGTDPSFAVDSIKLSTPISVGIAEASQALNVYVADGGIVISGNQSWSVLAVYDILGKEIGFTKNSNVLNVDGPAGIYFLSMTVEGQKITKKIMLHN